MNAPGSPLPAGTRTSDAPTLSTETLQVLPAAVDVPTYDRTALVPSVLHIGVGGFHRAHQAVYFDDLARRGTCTEWGITGVGLHRPEMGEVLTGQDGFYTVVVRRPEGDDVRVVGSVVRYLFAPEDPGAVLDALADERTRLVTLTITGTAYPDGGADPADEQVRADVEHPEAPATAFGYVVEGLDRRRRAGLPPFTVLSCDDVQRNGAAARRAVVSLARLRDPDLARWIEERVSFPSSTVDRATPETTPEREEEVVREHGVADRRPVLTEPFSRWIVEDDFCNGRPPLEEVGVQFVSDVQPYELMTARLLNGARSALGHLGYLAGFRTTAEAMADPVLRAYVEGYLAEASELLLPVPGIDLGEYCRTLVQRFSDPRISDQLTRSCRRGSTKVPNYVMPSLQLALDQERPRHHLVLALAAWLRYLRGEDYAGEQIVLEDADAGRLQPLAAQGGTDPRPVLAQHDVFGATGDDVRLTRELVDALRALEEGPLEAAAALPRPAGAPVRGSAA